MLDRMDWAYQRRERYLDWAGQVQSSSYSPLDKLEYALISAHTPFQASIKGFEDSRGLRDMGDIAEALNNRGVMGSFNKAARIMGLREHFAVAQFPSFPFREYRRHWKLPGLAYCKLSFGCCLISPLESDVVCIDTHIAQVYKERAERLWSRLSLYEQVESRLMEEAKQCNMPLFPYQWAIWDWKRLQGGRGVVGNRINSHDFLWKGGEREKQLPLFSGLV